MGAQLVLVGVKAAQSKANHRHTARRITALRRHDLRRSRHAIAKLALREDGVEGVFVALQTIRRLRDFVFHLEQVAQRRVAGSGRQFIGMGQARLVHEGDRVVQRHGPSTR